MMTDTSLSTDADEDNKLATGSLANRLIARVTRFEIIIGAAIALLMLALMIVEPNILEAPFENPRTLLFTVGGTTLAAVAFITMLWLRVPAAIRVIVLVVPFVIVNWWLLSPYFIDDVVDEEFSTSIAAQLPNSDEVADTPTAEPAATGDAASVTPTADGDVADEATPLETTEPALLGAGQFVGLAGHDGVGDAGIFENPDGSLVLRFENFDIENGPDLEVYLVPGADQTSLAAGSIHLGALEGNTGNQTYELPADTQLGSGDYTALVWCEAFGVEFVGATIAL
ncbi:MAG: DM13 domain-containing protein [Acidimicrobiales bacterium]